ncbi:NAD(P)H-binding protein [Spongiactinospora sp. 9N601]|uniref:NAD(P)H-binding protein n=1 Tax=Spongiactinospora sp. 9N601 TaxID=3375149 RepID=UPI0037AFFD58
MSVLVTGATGKVGRRVVERLERRGIQVRAASRSSATPLDWWHPAGWADALENVDRAFVVVPGGDDGHRSVRGLGHQVIKFLDVAEAADVGAVVLMTAMGMEYAPAEVEQRAVELHLQSGGMHWTILRPNWFHQNLTEGILADLAAANNGVLATPTGEAAVGFIDAADIAEVAAEVIAGAATDEHHGREYTLTGPKAHTFAEVAALSAATGGPLTGYHPASDEDFRERTAGLGWAEEYIDTLSGLFSIIASGAAARVTGDVLDILQRCPSDIEEFFNTINRQ